MRSCWEASSATSLGLASISDVPLNHTAKFTIAGVTPVDYGKGMKLTGHHIGRCSKISQAEPKKQPYTVAGYHRFKQVAGALRPRRCH